MKKELALVIDVETAGSIERPLVYDLGLAVIVRTTGEIVESHSLIIRDVFFDMPEQMNSAYYAKKLPLYYRGIHNHTYRVVRFWTAWRLIRDLIAKYSIHRVYAYNCAFDRRALNHTARVVTDNRLWSFFPRGVRFCCIWHMACQTILNQKRYRKFAYANGYVSPAGNLRTSAESCFAYITNNANFSETHMGSEDVGIEIQILSKVLSQHKSVNERVVYNPWRIPQRKVV